MPSSVITRFKYDADKSVLRIVFTSGTIYDYLNVPIAVYEAMKKSFSKGIYFNEHIKNHFKFKKMET